ELAEAELEDALHAGRLFAARLDGPVQGTEVAAGPEHRLEGLGRRARGPQRAALSQDDRPRNDRGGRQNPEHDLHEQARLENEAQDAVLEVYGERWHAASSSSGRRRGLRVVESSAATRTVASTRS